MAAEPEIGATDHIENDKQWANPSDPKCTQASRHELKDFFAQKMYGVR
jgi:hypothetical protein